MAATQSSMESRMKALHEKFGFACGNPGDIDSFLG
jgi:hypothetical protein